MKTIFVTHQDLQDLSLEDRRYARVALDLPPNATLAELHMRCTTRRIPLSRLLWAIDLFKGEAKVLAPSAKPPAPTPTPKPELHPLAQKLSAASLRLLCRKLGITPGVMGRNMMAIEIDTLAQSQGWTHDTLMVLLNTRAMPFRTYHRDMIETGPP